MHDLNRVQLIGHLGQDPAVTYTATGTARTTFSVATSARWKDADGPVRHDVVTDTLVPGSEAPVAVEAVYEVTEHVVLAARAAAAEVYRQAATRDRRVRSMLRQQECCVPCSQRLTEPRSGQFAANRGARGCPRPSR